LPFSAKVEEAENVLAVHPVVADVAVYGVPDSGMGRRVHSAVQLVPGVIGSQALEAELIEYCRSRIAHLKCPRRIDFVTSLPRTSTGKLQKRLLRLESLQPPGTGDRALGATE
jgi:long-chain acyl-CoA synthetase